MSDPQIHMESRAGDRFRFSYAGLALTRGKMLEVTPKAGGRDKIRTFLNYVKMCSRKHLNPFRYPEWERDMEIWVLDPQPWQLTPKDVAKPAKPAKPQESEQMELDLKEASLRVASGFLRGSGAGHIAGIVVAAVDDLLMKHVLRMTLDLPALQYRRYYQYYDPYIVGSRPDPKYKEFPKYCASEQGA